MNGTSINVNTTTRARLKDVYRQLITPLLMTKLQYQNVMQVPRIEKIVISMGVKEAAADPKVIDKAIEELMIITGQKAVARRAKKSIAGFKLRAGSIVGCMVTLRGNMKYEFLDRLINIVMPRIRDFRGFRASQFDGNGNFCFGIKEQIVFPEINYDSIDKIRGMNILINTTAITDKDGRALLEAFNVPFIKQ